MTRRLAAVAIAVFANGTIAAAQGVPATAIVPEQARQRIPVQTPPESPVTTGAKGDPLGDGIGRGALIGAGGMVLLFRAALNSCGKGCDSSSPAALMLAGAALGAGLGSVVGLAADLDARGPVRANHFFSGRPTARVGIGYAQTVFLASELEGSRLARVYAAAVQVSPHVSVHVEYTPINGLFLPAAGSVADGIVRNVIEATTRVAGHSLGVESRRVSYVFSELVGLHPSPWGRLRLEFLGGVAVRGQENRDFYDAHRVAGGQGRTEAVPGKYYVLDFEAPEVGIVLGADAHVLLMRHLIVAPSIRYHHTDDPGGSIAYGITARLRF